MGFLDNSRDIIVDAVLTDLGRRRLAENNASFKIVRFALGDDEINYGLYDQNHPSGSAYYDLDILQSPVFEAFTNNISTMNSRLVTYNSNTLLYLPVIKLNTFGTAEKTLAENSTTIPCGVLKSDATGTSISLTNVFLVAVDAATESSLGGPARNNFKNFIRGSTFQHNNYLRLDQGIDNAAKSNTVSIDQTLLEEEYTVEIDNRFGYLTYNNTKINPTFIDDDDIATYTFSLNNSTIGNVLKLAVFNSTDNTNLSKANYAVAGERGTSLSFGVYATEEMQNSTNYWFDKLGSQVVLGTSPAITYKIIHSTVTVTGLKTGYSIDIPVSFIKYISG